MGCQQGGHMTNFQNSKKTKVVALHCSFQNLFELCSKVLLLWRYEVKDFQKCQGMICTGLMIVGHSTMESKKSFKSRLNLVSSRLVNAWERGQIL